MYKCCILNFIIKFELVLFIIKNMILIGFAGKIGSGKTTCAKFIQDNYRNVVLLSISTPLKQMAKIVFDLSDEQLYDSEKKEIIDSRWGHSPRQILQVLGTDVFRNLKTKLPNIGESVWITLLESKLCQLKKTTTIVVVDDVRFDDEVETIKKFGGHVIYLKRPEEKTQTHASEQLDPCKAHEIIQNNRLEDTCRKICKTLPEYRKHSNVFTIVMTMLISMIMFMSVYKRL
jgi:hypothetical protein